MRSKHGQQIHKGLLLKRENNMKSQIALFTLIHIPGLVLICLNIHCPLNSTKENNLSLQSFIKI